MTQYFAQRLQTRHLNAATFEIWGALLNGGVVVVISRETTLSPAIYFPGICKSRHIDRAVPYYQRSSIKSQQTPKAFSTVRDLPFAAKLLITLTGEAESSV